MRFSTAVILLPFFALANLAASTPISPRQADPSCRPLSKLAAQLSAFEKFSTFILKNAPHNFHKAISDAQKGVASIVPPLDLLNPQVQSLQNTILADLSTVRTSRKPHEQTVRRRLWTLPWRSRWFYFNVSGLMLWELPLWSVCQRTTHATHTTHEYLWVAWVEYE